MKRSPWLHLGSRIHRSRYYSRYRLKAYHHHHCFQSDHYRQIARIQGSYYDSGKLSRPTSQHSRVGRLHVLNSCQSAFIVPRCHNRKSKAHASLHSVSKKDGRSAASSKAAIGGDLSTTEQARSDQSIQTGSLSTTTPDSMEPSGCVHPSICGTKTKSRFLH